MAPPHAHVLPRGPWPRCCCGETEARGKAWLFLWTRVFPCMDVLGGTHARVAGRGGHARPGHTRVRGEAGVIAAATGVPESGLGRSPSLGTQGQRGMGTWGYGDTGAEGYGATGPWGCRDMGTPGCGITGTRDNGVLGTRLRGLGTMGPWEWGETGKRDMGPWGPEVLGLWGQRDMGQQGPGERGTGDHRGMGL